MRIVRLYTGSDGESHLEELDPNLAPDFQSPRVATKVADAYAEMWSRGR